MQPLPPSAGNMPKDWQMEWTRPRPVRFFGNDTHEVGKGNLALHFRPRDYHLLPPAFEGPADCPDVSCLRRRKRGRRAPLAPLPVCAVSGSPQEVP